jgi:hypothetical protein
MGFLGGLLLPLAVYASLVDSAPVPPDPTGGWLIVGLMVSSLLIAAAYAWWSARHPDTWLRFLVAPMVWVAALAPGFAFKTDEALVGDAITRLVSAQPAISAAAIAITLLLLTRHPERRLAAPSFTAAVPAVPIAYLLTVALVANEGWADPAPLVLAGAASLVSVELLARRFGYATEVALARPLLLAIALAPLIPLWGVGRTGLIAVVAYLAMVEWGVRKGSDPVAVALTVAGVGGGLAMSVAEPWSMVVAWSLASVWAHVRRVDGLPLDDDELTATVAAATLPFGVAVGLILALPDGLALVVIGAVLVAVTAGVRWSKSDDVFWTYWLTGAGIALALGSVTWYLEGGGAASPWAAVTATMLAALTLAAGRDWPVLRVWMTSAAAAAALAIGLDVAAVTDQAAWWAVVGLATVAAATLWSRPAAAHLAVIGHLVGLGALLGGGSAEAGAIAVGAWSAGWLIAVLADGYGRPSVGALVGRSSLRAGAFGEEFRRTVEAAPSVILAASIPFAVLAGADLWDRFADNRSWTGVSLSLMAVGYAVVASWQAERRPLSSVFAVGAAVLSVAGIAASAPASWPVIMAAAATIAVSWLVARPRHWTLYIWFAWVMSAVMVILLAERAGVPVANLHLVVLGWGAVLLIGGLLVDEARAGRRHRGEGLRIRWLQYPVVLGALAIPLGLAPAYTQEPGTFGWWSLAAAAGYGVVAVLLRAGIVTAPAYALAALGVAALSPWPVLERPLILVPVAAVLVLASWGSERVQPGAMERYLRWDLPPLVVAQGVAFVALVRAVTVDSVGTWIAVGVLSVIVGVWKQHRVWVDIGNVLVLIAAAAAGPGWMALALAGTAVRGVISVTVTSGLERWSYHALGVIAIGAAWIEIGLWQGWSTPEVVSYTALAFGALGLVVGSLLGLRGLASDWAVAWGGLALVGTAASVALAIPGNVADVLPAVGTGLFAVGAGVAARSIRHPALKLLTVAATGTAWVELGLWQGWTTAQAVSMTALAFGTMATVVGAWIAFRSLTRHWAIAWAGLASAGIGTSVAVSMTPGTVTTALPAVGLILFALGTALAARTITHPALKLLTVAATGTAWIELALWQEWSSPEVASYTALTFGAIATVVGAWIAFRSLTRHWAIAWGGLALVGTAASVALAIPVNVVDVLPAVGLILFAVGTALAARSITHPALKLLTVAAVGLAWIELALWQEWSSPEVASYTALAFGAMATVVGAWLSLRTLDRDWALAWAGLAMVGWTASVVVAPDHVVDVLPALGSALFALGTGLTARRFPHPGIKALTVASTGVAWAELVAGVGWTMSQAVSYTSLAAGVVALAAALSIRFGRLSRSWTIAWGGLAVAAIAVVWFAGLAAQTPAITGLAPAIGLAMMAVAAQIGARPLSYPLHYAAVGLSGWSWISLATALGWSPDTASAITAIVFGGLAIGVAEGARSPWRKAVRSDDGGFAIEGARAWMGLGGAAVVTAAAFAVGADERLPVWLAVSAGLALVALALARGAAPLAWPPMRELSGVVLVAAVAGLGHALNASGAEMAAATIMLGVAATAGGLRLTRNRPRSPWRNPSALLGVAATGAAVAFAVTALPDRGPIVLVLLGVGVQLVATGIILEQPVVLSLGPPVLLAAWLGVAGEAVAGRALWFTVPIALTLLAEVDVVRWSRRRAEQPSVTTELLALEYAAIGLLGVVVLVEMFGTSAAYALLGFLLAGGLLLWAAATRVRRRAVAAGVLATVTAVLAIFAAAAAQAPPSAFFWIAAAGTGFAVMLSMAVVEAYRSKTGSTMLRFDQLMEGWE